MTSPTDTVDILARLDRLESLEQIRQLPAQYALAVDMRDLDALVNLFVDDVVAMTKPLPRQCADLTWDQAIAMEEFAEPMCFTTKAHRAAVSELLDGASGERR